MPIIPHSLAYLIGSLAFVPVWGWLFWRLPTHRQFMLWGGLTYMWLGLFVEYAFWTTDWWRPLTITETRVGIEDLIMCFTHVSIPIFLFPYVFGKSFQATLAGPVTSQVYRGMFFIGLFFSILFLTFFGFDMHSFYATSLALGLTSSIAFFFRRDLFVPALGSGIVSVLLVIPIYTLGHLLSPGVIEVVWQLRPLGSVWFGSPIEDLIWYFFIGMFFLTGYGYIRNQTLFSSPNTGLLYDTVYFSQKFFAWKKKDQKPML